MRGLVASVCVLLIAGCLGGGKAPAVDEVGDGLKATSDTGILRGLVVDDAIRPVADANVLVTRPGSGPMSASTREDGTFGFDGLSPGSYVVTASKAGYLDVTTTAGVRAGEDDVLPVQLQLPRDSETVAYVVEVAFSGFIECSIRGGTGGVQACRIVDNTAGIMNDNSEFDVTLDEDPEWVQLEMLWDPTQPLSDTMGFWVQQYRDDGTDSYMGIYPANLGTAPVLMTIDETGVGECSTCVEDPFLPGWDRMHVAAYGGDLSATRPPALCSPTGEPCLVGYGVVLEQSFDLYTHVFYRTVPPEGWQFSEDGSPPV